LDAESRIDGLDLVGQEPGHAIGIAQRPAGSDAHRLGTAIDAMADQIEPSRAEAFLLQRVTELAGELADVAGDGLCRADGSGEGAANLDQFLGADRFDRLSDPADRLVEPVTEFGADA